jgi:gluconokinase
MVIIVMGVTATGKSTLMRALAARLGWGEVEADEFHSQANVDKMARGTPLDDVDRWPWLDAVAAEIARRAGQGQSVVVACSALKRAYRDRLRAAAPRCLFVYLKADMGFVQERLKERTEHFMPPSLAKSQFETLEPPRPDEHSITVPAAQPTEQSVDQIVAGI